MQPAPSKIQLLPEHIIDQIKAGEVIERPSSLIKELIENAIDAGASKIEIHIVEQGLKLIEVSDNGHGMEFHDLPFAFCRHATSKISTFEDLYRLSSFGFRGEALASMASISKITCVSHTKEGTGGKIIFNGGEQELHIKENDKKAGTSFYVRDLFFNTPVRLKFIKSKNSEQNAIKKIIEAFLISNPQIEFHVRFDEKDKEIYESKDRWQRICDVFNIKHVETNLKIELKKQYLENSLDMVLVPESILRSSQKFQLLFVNNRLIVDRQIHAVVSSFAESLIPGQKLSCYCLFLNVPADELDANVHPNKTFVKFKNFGAILGLISASLKNYVSELPISEKEQESLPLLAKTIQKNQNTFKDLNTAYISNAEMELDLEVPKHFALTSSIILANKEGQYFLLHLPKLMNHYFLQNKMVTENTPILISEPYEVKTVLNPILEDLTKLGFEFDRLSEQAVVLRSLPEWLVPLNYKNLLYHFFAWIKQNPKKSFQTFIQTDLPDDFFDAKTKSFLLKEFMENSDMPEGVVCLDEATLQKFFK